MAAELNIRAPATAILAIHDPLPRTIAISLSGFVAGLLSDNHREAGEACKLEFGKPSIRYRSQIPAAPGGEG
jgi:hypothetical protein